MAVLTTPSVVTLACVLTLCIAPGMRLSMSRRNSREHAAQHVTPNIGGQMIVRGNTSAAAGRGQRRISVSVSLHMSVAWILPM